MTLTARTYLVPGGGHGVEGLGQLNALLAGNLVEGAARDLVDLGRLVGGNLLLAQRLQRTSGSKELVFRVLEEGL